MRIKLDKQKMGWGLKWKPFFAWHPVTINCGYPHEIGTIVWLEMVDRKWWDSAGRPLMHYQLSDSAPPPIEEYSVKEIK